MPNRPLASRYAVPATTRPGGNRIEDAAFEDLLDAYTNRLRYTQGRSWSTSHTYARHLRDAYRYLAIPYPELVGVERFTAAGLGDLEDFIAHEGARGIAPGTRHTAVYALRSLYGYLVDRHGLAANPAKALKGPRAAARTPEHYTETEAMTLLEYAASQAERDPRRAVGYVAMTTFFCTGIRLKELAGIRLSEVNMSERRIDIMGKGSKRREVPIDVTGAAVLGWYLDEVRPHLPGAASSEFVFINPKSHPNGRYVGRFAGRSLEQLVNAFGTEAGLPGRHFPHKLRHTFASLAIRRGMSAFTLQGILGHAHVSTTEIYVHLIDADRAAEHDRVFGRRPLPLPAAVANRPGALARTNESVRIAGLLARQAAKGLQAQRTPAAEVRDAAQALAPPAARVLISVALTAILELGNQMAPDFSALLTEHGEPFIVALSVIAEVADPTPEA